MMRLEGADDSKNAPIKTYPSKFDFMPDPGAIRRHVWPCSRQQKYRLAICVVMEIKREAPSAIRR